MERKPDVLRTRPMADESIIEAFSKQDVATVHEAMGKRGAMRHQFKPVDERMKMCGRALTVKCHSGDNLMLIKAISMAQPGDVVVADMGSIVDNGPFGEVLAVEAATKGVSGLVVTGSVRDSAALSRMMFPVFSEGVCVYGTSKATKGTINHPITVGGVYVNPGDIVLGDRDGVVIIPLEEAAEVLKAANDRTASEAVVMDRLRKGETLFDIYDYQKVFDRLGITEEA